MGICVVTAAHHLFTCQEQLGTCRPCALSGLLHLCCGALGVDWFSMRSPWPSAAEPPELEGMPVPKGGSLLDWYDEAMVTAEV